MRRDVFGLSISLSVATVLVCMNSASAQGGPGSPGWVQQPGPAGGVPGWTTPGGGPGGYVQQPGPAGAQPGWATPGQRPGNTGWEQQPGPPGGYQANPNWAQQQSQNWAQQQAQNAQMTQQALQAQQNQPKNPFQVKCERWVAEWKTQHPNEPVPNLGVLEHMHEGEIVNQVKADGQDMWARRQQELKSNYLMAKRMQESKNAAAHVVWGQAQWAQWDKEYDAEQRQQADDYIRAWNASGEAARNEAANKEYRRSLGLDY